MWVRRNMKLWISSVGAYTLIDTHYCFAQLLYEVSIVAQTSK